MWRIFSKQLSNAKGFSTERIGSHALDQVGREERRAEGLLRVPLRPRPRKGDLAS